MTPWFRLPTDDVISGLFLASSAALLAVAVLAHVPARIPGPLTPGERRAALSPGWTRALAAVGVVLALGAAVATLLTFAPPAIPRALVLQSRARAGRDIKWEAMQVLSSEDPNDRQTCRELLSAESIDLGPEIDGAIAQVAEREPHWTGRPGSDSAIARALGHAVVWPDRYPLVPSAELSSAPDSAIADVPLFPWFLQSLEMTAVARAVHSRKVTALLLAPAESMDPSSLALLADYLHQQNILTCVVDYRPERPAEGGPRVERLARARLAEGRLLQFYALVHGRLTGDATLTFRWHHGQGTGQEFRVRLKPDGLGNRLLLVCLAASGACGTGTTPADAAPEMVAQISELIRAGSHVYIESRNGDEVTQVLPAERDSTVQLDSESLVTMPARIAALFDLTRAIDSPGIRELFRRELASEDIALLSAAAASPLRRAKLRSTSRAVIVAATDAGLAAGQARVSALDRSLAPWPGSPQLSRIIDSRLGDATTFSLVALSLPGMRTREGAWPRSSARASDGAGSQNGQGAQRQRIPNGGVAFVSAPKEPKYVVLRWTRDQLVAAAASEIVTRLAVLKALSWAATWVTDPDVATPLCLQPPLCLTDDQGTKRLAAPLLDESELDEAFRQDVHGWDLLCVALVGTYLFYRRRVGEPLARRKMERA